VQALLAIWLATLKRVLEREERPKIDRVNPARYILCTSVGLTPANKAQLVGVLQAQCQSTQDIFGCDDLNALLRDHPEVEKQHHKLWLTSATLLEKILRNAAAVWNDMVRAEIERKLSLYVQTDAFNRAMAILKQHHYVIISGIPGIGKTTLAQVLVTHFIDHDYDLVAARESAREAFDAFDSRRKQIICYDDFLGRSSFADRFAKNEEYGLLRLLAEVTKSKSKRAILTTREYILQEARQHYELLSGPELNVPKCIIELESYTRAQRARILYNHLYFSDLPPEYAEAVVGRRGYRRIVDHDNYSPRVIEWMTSALGAAHASPDEYPDLFLSNLDNPSRLWKHAFEHQLAPDARLLLLVLTTFGDDVDIAHLETAWSFARCGAGGTAPGEEHLRFLSALRQLDGSFVRTQRIGQDTAVSTHNPSIRDFLAQRIGADARLAEELLGKAVYFEQVAMLVQLDPDGKRAKTVSGLVRDSPTLRSAIERTICASRATLLRVRSGHGGDRYWREPMTLGARFSAVAQWASTLGCESLIAFAVTVAMKRDREGQLPGDRPATFVGFLEALLAPSKCEPERRKELLELLVEYIDASLHETAEASDWADWGRFVSTHDREPDLGAWSDLQERALQYCEIHGDAILGNAESADEIDYARHELRGVAEAWELEIRDLLVRLNDEAMERRSREPDDDDLPYEPDRGAARAEVSTDGEIDRLFLSLRPIRP